MAEARLQDEDVETGGASTDDEFVTSVYMLEGKYFSISKESQETIKMLTDQIREALPDTRQRTTDTERIIDRVQTLMSTNLITPVSTYCQYKVIKYNKDNTCSKLRGSSVIIPSLF